VNLKTQPRDKGGKFGVRGGDTPTSNKPVSFKFPRLLCDRLEAAAQKRGASINLIVKEFVIKNSEQMVSLTELSQPRGEDEFGARGGIPTSDKLTDLSLSRKPVSFKIPRLLRDRLEVIASNRGTSINLIIKEFVIENSAQMLAEAESTKIK
jgi:predicted DNA-binding protein